MEIPESLERRTYSAVCYMDLYLRLYNVFSTFFVFLCVLELLSQQTNETEVT